MYRVSRFVQTFAAALLAGAALATLWVNLAPESYYDTMEWRLLPLPFWLGLAPVTPISLVVEALMALFLFLLGKELWEANVLERGALHGRRAGLPLLATLGGVAGAALVWVLVSAAIETAEEARIGAGWAVPLGSDAVLAYVVGRRVFGTASPALHLLLLITIGSDLVALLAIAFAAPVAPLRLLWLALPLVACLAVWAAHGRHTHDRRETGKQRAAHLWPYLLAGLLSWLGVVMAGLPGALGLLPVIPAIPHSERSFGLFAEAEEFLHDPLNRLAHLLVRPVAVVLFLFGLTCGGIDLAAFAPTTVVTLAALWIGKPLGVLAGTLAAWRLLRLPLPAGIGLAGMARIAGLSSLAFTLPALAIGSAIPGGAMAEAARLGLALGLLAIPVLLLTRPR